LEGAALAKLNKMKNLLASKKAFFKGASPRGPELSFFYELESISPLFRCAGRVEIADFLDKLVELMPHGENYSIERREKDLVTLAPYLTYRIIRGSRSLQRSLNRHPARISEKDQQALNQRLEFYKVFNVWIREETRALRIKIHSLDVIKEDSFVVRNTGNDDPLFILDIPMLDSPEKKD